MESMTVTKRICRNGTSLAVSLTKELKELGADVGDWVQITVSKPIEMKEDDGIE